MDETDDLFFQSLPNSVAFRLQNEPFRVFFCIKFDSLFRFYHPRVNQF